MKLPENPTDEQIEEFNNRQLFVRDAMPDSWLSYAEELEEAAETLWGDSENGMLLIAETQLDQKTLIKKSPRHSRSYILLAGLALENVIKGLIIANNAKLISSGELDRTLKSHKLLTLAKKLNKLVLSSEEIRVLQICQDAIPYWGRYPVPLEYQGLQPSEAANEEFRAHFRQLHFRLCKQLYELIKGGWDSDVGPRQFEFYNKRYVGVE